MPATGSVEGQGRKAGHADAGQARPAAKGRVKMIMAFHTSPKRKPFLIVTALSLLVLGIGVGLVFG